MMCGKMSVCRGGLMVNPVRVFARWMMGWQACLIRSF